METVTRIHTVRERVSAWRQQKLRVALVPTMGNLHKGHASLVALAKARADKVVVSAFVNPMQFGPNEDFQQYPRTLEHDTQVLQKVEADLMFHPNTFEMYPMGHERSTMVDVAELSGILCGAFRPGHFAGVTTIVTKLFNIIQPDVAVFGEKDYQQLVIIKRLVADLCLNIEVLAAPTVRDHDGLAWSSRNRYLSRGHRDLAPRLYEALKAAKQKLQGGDKDFEGIQKAALQVLEHIGFEPEYFAIRQAEDLQPVRESSKDIVILAAVRLGKTRLIDNIKMSLGAGATGIFPGLKR